MRLLSPICEDSPSDTESAEVNEFHEHPTLACSYRLNPPQEVARAVFMN